MLFLPRGDYWQKVGIREPLHRFLVLAWNELFNADTPDKWEVRTANLRFVLQELLEAADTVEAHERYGHNVVVLLAEAREMADTDPVVVKHFPFASDALAAAESAGADAKAMGKVRSLARVLLARTERYEEHAAADLRQLVAENSKKKDEAHQLLMSLAVAWSARGYSPAYLSRIGRGLVDPSAGDFPTRFDTFLGRCDGQRRGYRCRFAMPWPKELAHESLNNLGWQLTRGWPLGSPGSWSGTENQFYKTTRRDDIFADVVVSELDAWSATRAAAEALAGVTAALRLYFPLSRLVPKGQVALVYREDGTHERVPFTPSHWASLHPARDPERHMQEFQAMMGRLPRQDAGELLSSLQYYRLALEAETSESRLVNLWIALESLCRRVAGTSIIDKVCDYVVPGVALNNLRRTVEATARYLQMMWKRAAEDEPAALEAIRPFFPRSTEEAIDPQDTLDALLGAKDTPGDDALYGLVGTHELIRNRVSRLQERVFGKSEHAASEMRRHARHVDWQIRRIYRARNQVMHQGRRGPRIENLIRHLQTYLVVMFNNLIHDFHENAGWTLPDALEYRVFLYNQFMKRLTARDRPFPRQAILEPALILTNTSASPAWATPQ